MFGGVDGKNRARLTILFSIVTRFRGLEFALKFTKTFLHQERCTLQRNSVKLLSVFFETAGGEKLAQSYDTVLGALLLLT